MNGERKQQPEKEKTGKPISFKTPIKASVKNNLRKSRKPASKLKIIPLGGLGEIGKNLTIYEYGKDMFLVDCGLAFPDQDMLGVDLVLPDFTYVERNADRIRGIVITHGHEDHIGGLP